MLDLREEAQQTAKSKYVPWDKFNNTTVLITGITGLVGSACARTLLERNRAEKSNIRIAGIARNAKKAQKTLAGYGKDDGLVIYEAELPDIDGTICQPDYIIHAACPTASQFFAQHPVETADTIVMGTRHLLRFAYETKVKGFVCVSSMEVYGNGNPKPGLDRLLDESKVGYVNPLSIRSCYPEGKRMAEQYCSAFATEYHVPAMTVRLAQTFGPGIPKDDTRLFAMCARNAMAGEDIVLKTTGASTRMYLYTADAVTALLSVLINGVPGAAYNAANPSTYSSVKQMAERVASLFPEKPVQVRCEPNPNAPYPPEHHLPLDISALKQLGWEPTMALEDMYKNLIAYLED